MVLNNAAYLTGRIVSHNDVKHTRIRPLIKRCPNLLVSECCALKLLRTRHRLFTRMELPGNRIESFLFWGGRTRCGESVEAQAVVVSLNFNTEALIRVQRDLRHRTAHP